ncbi:hypothetical protein WG622_17330 [Cognatishimia sp. D5M38]|uniref:Type II secretion system protein F n=1 Tax=Cognatishimia coralii TaxID=3083254 RepID=A0ABU8QL11_9RHOB
MADLTTSTKSVGKARSQAPMLANFGFGRKDRAMAWQLIADITEAGIDLDEALRLAGDIFEQRGKKSITGRLTEIRRGHTQNRFVEVMAQYAPGPESALFSGLGSVDTSAIFAGASRILQVQRKINSAVIKALATPALLFVLIFMTIYFAGTNLFPILSEITSFDQLDIVTSGFIDFSLWFADHPFIMFGVLGFFVFAVSLSVPLYTGPARAYLDRIPPYSLYRLATGCAFAMSIVESARAGQDITGRFLLQMSERLDPYSRSKIRKIASGMKQGNIGTACHANGEGFPAPDLNAVWAAFDKRDDWVDPLARFLSRWLEDVEERAKQTASILNTFMIGFAAFSIGLILNTIFAVLNNASQGGL